MEGLSVPPGYDPSLDQKWSKMVIISLAIHMLVFSTILFIPESMTSRSIRDVVYEVNLVEMPAGRRSSMESSAQTKKEKGLTAPAPTAPAKRIDRPKPLEKPLTISKRTIDANPRKITPPEASSTKLLDQALARIEKKVKEEQKETADQPVSKVETSEEKTSAGASARGTTPGQPAGTAATGRPGGVEGIVMDFYRAEIKEMIYRNWSYPTAMLDKMKDLSAVVVLKVEKNGTILSTTVTQRSGNEIFDQSVLNAIKRSDPLPPFPESYRKTDEEIEISFTLRDLKNQ